MVKKVQTNIQCDCQVADIVPGVLIYEYDSLDRVFDEHSMRNSADRS
jgi:hypothetical protein